MAETAIKQCSCKHDGQDQLYGKGLRLFNQTMKDKGTIYRCSVCTKEKT